MEKEISADPDFRDSLIRSLFEQYSYLLEHLEKHLLANHYFEDLKALTIAAAFFGDEKVLEVATSKLIEQCGEQIRNDGMQYERSPMYQKILLEDLIRVEAALESRGKKNGTIRGYIKKMLDVSYSLESGLDRLPLFNDCGSNITKSLKALADACAEQLGIYPEQKYVFPDSGFCVFEFGDGWKLIVDSGQPGPDYSPGHSHCEAMSFELFRGGKPLFVNCGTFAYQCEQRGFFKSTRAHNTVTVKGCEQSEYWSSFRMARRARMKNAAYEADSVSMLLTDYMGHQISRTITIKNNRIEIEDISEKEDLETYIHFTERAEEDMVKVERGEAVRFDTPYAEEFGLQRSISALKISGRGSVKYSILIGDESHE